MTAGPPTREPGGAPVIEAACVLLTRGPDSRSVFLVRRAPALRAFGGLHAFPGGKVAPADAEVLPANPRCATAARELFEETGVLVARRADGNFLSSRFGLVVLRRELLEARLTFPDLLSRLGLTVSPDDFLPIGTLVTPPFAPLRFDTQFYVAHLPPGQEATVWPGELDEGRWVTAAESLDEWTRGACLISPPTLTMLEAIREHAVADIPERLAPHFRDLAAGVLPAIYWSPEVQMLPLRTAALPPSTHTSAYLVGRDPAYLIDPGPSDPSEQQVLFQALDRRIAEGMRLRAVILTHQHPDHIGAAYACAERYAVPIWAHPRTAELLTDKVKVDRALNDGDRLDLGATPDGSGPWHLEALHTPGHASGHLAFYEPHYRLLFAGDLISTLTSVVICPPDGDLAAYLESLRRLQRYDCRLLLPAHGSPSADPARVLREAIAHRLVREEQLVEALQAGPRTVEELGPLLYRGLPSNLMRFAEMQIQAGLLKLQAEGRAQPDGNARANTWRLANEC